MIKAYDYQIMLAIAFKIFSELLSRLWAVYRILYNSNHTIYLTYNYPFAQLYLSMLAVDQQLSG
jgi:hypothetical protein